MKKLLSLGVVCLLLGMTITALFGSRDRSGNDEIRDRFVGAWRLAWLEEKGADGEIHRADCTGLLVYTRDGHMSVQVMYRNPQASSQATTNEFPAKSLSWSRLARMNSGERPGSMTEGEASKSPHALWRG